MSLNALKTFYSLASLSKESLVVVIATEAEMDIKKIDSITERIVTAADQIRG
jgi:hypothetical protein